MLDFLALLRWPVAAALIVALILTVIRWGRGHQDFRSRLLAVSLAGYMVATLIGTIDAIIVGKPGGGQVPSYLLATLAAIYALAAQDQRHPTTSQED